MRDRSIFVRAELSPILDAALPATKAEELALALLDFRSVADLDAWLEAHAA